MGERIPASIQFGGKISRADAEELVNLVNAEGLDPAWGDSGDVTVANLGECLASNEVNYGNLDDLEIFATEHGLAYVQWFDAGCDWTQGGTKRDLEGRVETYMGTVDEPLYSAPEIMKHGVEVILEEADWLKMPLPPLEIVDDATAS